MASIIFPLRCGRPYGAGAASFTFLLAGGEFGALTFGSATVFGLHPSAIPFALAALPAAYVVAAAAAGVMFLVTRGRSVAVLRPVPVEAVDLDSLRARVAAPRDEAPEKPASKTRLLLDEYRAQRASRPSTRR